MKHAFPITKRLFCFAAIFGLLVAAPTSEVQANIKPGDAVYLWKDLNGKCPTTCDNNNYSCPCRSS